MSDSEPEEVVEKAEVPVRPAYVPETYWKADEGSVDLERAFKDLGEATASANRFRLSLSRKEHEVPKEPKGYDFSKIGMNEKQAEVYGKFAHGLGLTTYQAEKLFGEDGDKFSQELEEASREEIEERRKEFFKGEVEKFGGDGKVKELSARVERLKTGLVNRGILTEEEFQKFKESAMTNANNLKTMNSILDHFENTDSAAPTGPAGLQHGPIPAGGLQGEFHGKSKEEMVAKVSEMLKKCNSEAERREVYSKIAFLSSHPATDSTFDAFRTGK
jgi:hypothetical protein